MTPTPRALARIAAVLAALAALPATAQPDLEKKCLEGHAESCARVAQAAVPEQGAKDFARAALFSLRACAAAEPEAPYCSGAGAAVESIRGDPAATKKLRDGLEAMSKACEGGRIHECNALGEARFFGTAGEPDTAAAKALFTRACEGGAAAGCANLGDLLAKGGDADRARAMGLYAKSCGGGAAWTCKIAGLGHVRGIGAPKDMVAAARAFKRGCDGRDQRACFLLVSLYQQDPAAARDVFRKACGMDVKQCAEYEALMRGADQAAAAGVDRNKPR